MGNSINALTPKMAIVGALTLASGASAATTLTGLNYFYETGATSGGNVAITDWAGGPNSSVSYPYLEVGEYYTASGAYDSRIFLKISLGSVSVPGGQKVSGAKLGLGWYDSTYGGYQPAHSDNVDLWSTADEFTGSLTAATYNGTNSWTDGPQAGINGYLRTGPVGRHLASLYKQGTEPAGTPSNKIINGIQEFKILEGPDLDNYLNAQILAGKDAYLALSIDNDSGYYQRFIATSDNGTYWATATGLPVFGNQPYLFIDTAPVPEPVGVGSILVLGGLMVFQPRSRS